jgi:hypothetical protein
MSRRGKAVLAIGLVAGLAVGVGSAAAAGFGSKGKKDLHVIEHATTDTVVDIGDPGDSTGDLLTFHNDVYDQSDTTVVGTDQGECVRIDPAAGSWECRWITILQGGSITVEGQFLDTANTVLAITGGMGAYSKARGEMSLLSREGGTKFDFVFDLNG